MTDQELVNLIRAGRKDLFSEVVIRYEPKISRYIKSLFGTVMISMMWFRMYSQKLYILEYL